MPTPSSDPKTQPTDELKPEQDPRVRWFVPGAVTDTAGPIVQTQMSNMIYNVELGMSPVLLGVGQTIMRIWDAFADPFVGSWSDRTRSRFGRRRPFVFFGSILVALFFPFIWFCPPGWSAGKMFAYYLGTSLVFLTAHTVYSMPWRAWGAELSPNYHGRTRVWGRVQLVTILVYFSATWIYAFISSDWFDNPVAGMRSVSLMLAGAMLVGGLIPCLMLREKKLPAEKVRGKVPPRERLIALMRQAFKLKEMRILTGISMLLTLGLNSVGQIALYLHIFYLYQGDKAAGSVLIGWSGTVAQTASFLAVPLGIKMSRWLGKRRALEVTILITMTGILCKWWLYNPNHPYLVLVAAALMAPVQVGLHTLMYSMLADVCDLDELQSGRRQEGLYTAAYSWVAKTSLALTSVIAGVAISLTGFDAALGAAQGQSTLLAMLAALIVIPVVALIAALFLIKRYSLDETRVHEIQLQLAAQRAGQAGED